jgi:hypothetical protein
VKELSRTDLQRLLDLKFELGFAKGVCLMINQNKEKYSKQEYEWLIKKWTSKDKQKEFNKIMESLRG